MGIYERFITFEGPDGGGKTTQLNLLGDYLVQLGYPVIRTREPGGTALSNQIRKLLLDPANVEMCAKTEVLLYAAARAQHVEQVILPALEQGKIVLCDRYVDASIAYQGFGLSLPVEQVMVINRFATGGLVPTRTYLVDIPWEASIRRLSKRKGQEFYTELDRIEQREKEFHLLVRKGFEHLFYESQGRMVRIDGNRPREEVFADLCKDITTLLGGL
jgi:dTMP kinase